MPSRGGVIRTSVSMRRLDTQDETSEEEMPGLADTSPIRLARTLVRLQPDENLSSKVWRVMILLRTTAVGSTRVSRDILARIFARAIRRGNLESLANALIATSPELVSKFYVCMSAAERRLWVNPPTTPPRDGMLHALAAAMANNPHRQQLHFDHVCTLLSPFGWFGPFARIVCASGSASWVPQLDLAHSFTSSSEFSQAVGAFLTDVEELYAELPLEARRVGTHLSQLLEATSIFLRNYETTVLTQHVVRLVIHRIELCIHHDDPLPGAKNTDSCPASTPSGRLSYYEHLLVAAGITSHLASPTLAKTHPASPHLLVAIYVAKYSKFASKMMLDQGLLSLLERLFDEPRHAIRFPVVTYSSVDGIGRGAMHELSYELIMEISKYTDLPDCTIKQELRDEIVAASRASSMRYHCIQWWEMLQDDFTTSQLKEILKADGFDCTT